MAGPSQRHLYLLGFALFLSLVAVAIVTYGLASRTRQQMLENQNLTYTPPTTPVAQQVKRVLIRREGPNGVEYLEILLDGTINLYDANMKLIKTGLQGYGRVNSILDDFAKNLYRLDQYLNGRGRYTITIYTNQGTYTYTSNGTGSGNTLLDDLVDEIDDLVDDTFTPTPTPAPTYTPAPPPTAGPSPTSPPAVPTPTIPWNPLTPTPLPAYMTNPPFICSDYDLNRPTNISNIICFPD